MSECRCPPGQSCICLDDGKIHWQTFLDTIAGLASPTFECVVAELIDNSLDHDSTEVEVELIGKNDDDFSVIVYDNGTGISTEDDLLEAFSLAHLEAKEPPTNKEGFGKTGKFNFGLKISPVSRCNHVALMSTAGGQLIHRRLDKRQVELQEKYGTISAFLDHKATVKARKKLVDENGGKKGFKTAVVLSGFNKFLSNIDYSPTSFQNHGRHLKEYFGLIYQKKLQQNTNITIRIKWPGSEAAGFNVEPLDPFWKDLTPERISERVNLAPDHPDHIDQDHRYVMECFKEWGTIELGPLSMTYSPKTAGGNIIGKFHISVTGYVIPSRNLHPMIPKKYKKNVFDTGHSKSPSNLLLATKLGGIYFYREGRLIAFGDNNKDPDANQGWYELLSTVESRHSVVRIEIDLPKELDKEFGLTGSKDKYTPPKRFLKNLVANLATVVDQPELRAGIGDGTKPFWEVNAGQKSHCAAMTSVRESSKGSGNKNPSRINKDCKFCSGEPKPWHHIQTVCPKMPCKICGKVGECKDGCDYECNYCGDNHKEENCPLNCPHCEYPQGAGGHPEDEPCPALCEDCGQISCRCPCEKGCGQDKSHCAGDCDQESEDEGKKSRIQSFPDQGLITLHLYRNSANEKTNQALVKEALEFLSQGD